MRNLTFLPIAGLVCLIVGCATGSASADQISDNKAQCASFGFREGTDSFAKCVMQLSLRQRRQRPPDRDTLVQQYRDLSMARRGDGRYPVCNATMMENELDTYNNKWVGPNCQMAPD